MGIVIILRPGIAIINPAALVVLAGALAFAGANIATKALTRSDSPLTILFWMFAVQAAVCVVIAGPTMFWPPAPLLPWALVVGLAGLAAHYCTARSLALADASVVIPLHYLRVPMIAVVGWISYQEAVDIWLGIGAVIIFIGTLMGIKTGRATSAK